MKYRILSIFIILLTLLSITVSASSYEFTISTGDGFVSVNHGDDLTVVSEKLNTTPQELNSYFAKNGLLYLSVSDDAKTQIKISAFTDNFSSSVNDISYLDDDTLTEFISAVSEGSDSPAEVVLNNDRKYLCVKDILRDSGGVYTVTQYITICNNKTFYFAGYNEGEDTADEITTAFKSFSLQEKVLDTPDYTIPIAFVIVGIVVFSLVAVIMVIGIIKSYLKDKSANISEVEKNEN